MTAEESLTDEQIAFLLQQEEYNQVEVWPSPHPATKSAPVTPASSITKWKDVKGTFASMDDDEEQEYEVVTKKAAEVTCGAHDSTLGILDIHELFVQYNDMYFEGKLAAVSVEWSQKMTLCAGLCSWKFGDCRIKLSAKLLQYRSNKELKEVLLHECIHAYLFVTHNNKDRDGHGPEFLKKMNFINSNGGFNITVYHSFHDEVSHFRTHWWQCDKCKYIIKRAMNRAPGPSDWWWPRHQSECGGSYTKIKSPPVSENPKKRKRDDKSSSEAATPTKLAKGADGKPEVRSRSILDHWRIKPVVKELPPPESTELTVSAPSPASDPNVALNPPNKGRLIIEIFDDES